MKRKTHATFERVTEVLRNKLGKKVSALIQSFPAKRFDERYRSDLHDQVYEDENGNPITQKKFQRIAEKKKKKAIKKFKTLKK